MIAYRIFVRTAKETGIRKKNEKEKKDRPCMDNDTMKVQRNWPGGMGGNKNAVKARKKKNGEVIYQL